ncbi:MAG: response regulator, partial [Verrucomicrobiota bacterium]|nr:response regulator [Verrucomicrobiota bacterium]
ALNSAEKSLQQLTRENSTKEQDIARLNKALSALRGEPAPARATAPAAPAGESPSLRLARSAGTPAVEDSDAVNLAADVGLYKSLLEEVPEILKKIRRCLQYFVRHPDDLNLLHELVRHTESICEKTDMPEFEAFHRLSTALGALMRDLYARPDQVNPPLLRTVCQSFDFLGTLFEEPNRSRTGDLASAKVLAVDDDAGILDALGAALEMVDLKMDGVDNSRHALEVLARRNCDLIFLDVGLPEMTGIELCEQIRQLPNHAKTPIVFLTGLATIENRVQSTLKGANDFICKPFNLMELDVKALSWLLKKRLDML